MHDLLQTRLFTDSRLTVDALALLSSASAEERGAIHTRPEVAKFILDAVGWTENHPLETCRLLEPSSGEGDFLLPAVDVLLRRVEPDDLSILKCIRSVEVSHASWEICRSRVEALFSAHGWNDAIAASVIDAWLLHDDFLSVPLETGFTHIVGNPPYIRLEHLPKNLLKAYRARWKSLFDRADLYVAFIEKSLGLLAEDGRLGFICADRWMKNRYGGPLREMVARDFHLECYVDFTGCPAFFSEVDAYPAVTVIRRGSGNITRVAFRPEVNDETLTSLARAFADATEHPQITLLDNVCRGDDPWGFHQNPVIAKLEAELPALEDAGCKVGIGVATGADAVFIGSDAELDVEEERRLPLVTTKDIRHGDVQWNGLFVLNPFGTDGRLVCPSDYPRFQAYIEKHREQIGRRNVAKRTPAGWFRTIDRIHPALTTTPKLLIPDIKGSAHVVLEHGHLYPHHNLYYVVSGIWDLRVLQLILSSRVAHAFIATYSPRMRGNFLRFQAQYLRRIRIPVWETLSAAARECAVEAAGSTSQELRDAAVQRLYQLSPDEWESLTACIDG